MENDKLMMWECKCGVTYEKDLEECPLCHSKKRKKSKYKNFPPIELKKNEVAKVDWTIEKENIKREVKIIKR